ncbi:MAG: ABC transporter ATP-binding protein [Propionibacteriaceae bacterium]|jgi:ABC-type dipeptide/oligopeptide/nickel transport system ATPase component|nr:ABC transporter ATP-binding protein [Propionibacteriaceae bacterium]
MTGLRIENLKLEIRTEDEVKPILKGVDLSVDAGTVQGLAGESGSGKTMTGLAIIGLEPPTAITSGKIMLGDTDLLQITGSRLNTIRGNRVGMVFQDPSTSLHPQLSIGSQLTDHVRYHLKISKSEARDRAVGALERVGITGGLATLSRYPHEFSGGQRQRIAIAIALACDPELVIMDEPTTALDVTVQAGVLELVRRLVDSLGLAVLFISHDLGVMSAIADDVAVMRHGVVVENGPSSQVFTNPHHEYTRALLASLPGTTSGPQTKGDLVRLAEGSQDCEGGAS